jgi:hypothetical protein
MVAMDTSQDHAVDCFGAPPYSWCPVDLDNDPTWHDDINAEQMGTKEKHWVADPDDRRWLLKFGRHDDSSKDGQAEDVAECLVHALAGLIGVPSACIRPARSSGRRAIVSRSVLNVGNHEQLVHGNELLHARDDRYQASLGGMNPEYTVPAVRTALDGIAAAPGSGDAFEAWTGYLVLDAWVNGVDRHHENWGVIRCPDGQWLAPSYDHGSALGSHETPASIERRRYGDADPAQRETAVERFAKKGRSPFDGGRSLIDVAHQALSLCDRSARDGWLTRLAGVPKDAVEAILSAVPAAIVSEERQRFIMTLLLTNQRRLLNATGR